MTGRELGRTVTATAVAATALKLLGLVLDPLPILFMGDLEVFLDTALFGAIPTARPWLYGGIVHVVSGWQVSLTPLLLVQAAAGAATAAAVAWMAAARLGVRPWLAVAAGCAVAVAPHQLYWERAVMTESAATGLFVLGLAYALRAAGRSDVGALVVLQLLGVAAVAMRFQLLPAVVSVFPLPPLVLAATSWSATAVRARRRLVLRAAAHFVLAAALLTSGLAALKRLNGELAGRPSALGWEDGYFLVAAWAPVLEPGDAPDPRVAAVIAQPGEYPLADHRHLLAQRWAPGGLVDRLRSLDPDPLVTNQWAKKTALAALVRDPLGVAWLAADTWLGYWDQELMDWMIRREQGQDFAPTPRVIELLGEHFGLAATPEWCLRLTPSRRWHRASLPWFRLLTFAPLLGLGAVIFSARGRLGPTVLLAWSTVPLLATAVAFNLPVPRMLHPLEPVAIALLAVLAEATLRRLRHS